MKVALRVLFGAALLVGAYFVGSAAIAQFESFEEFGTEYLASGHLLNIVVLALVAVTLVAAAISVLADKMEQNRAFFDDFVRAVFFGTAGVVGTAFGFYEAEVNEFKIYPFVHSFHPGDIITLCVVGIALVVLGLYYLLRQRDAYEWPTGPIDGTADRSNEVSCGCIYCRAIHPQTPVTPAILGQVPFGYMPLGFGPFFAGSARPVLTVVGPELLDFQEDTEDKDKRILVGFILTVEGQVVEKNFTVFSLSELEKEDSEEPKHDKPVKPADKVRERP